MKLGRLKIIHLKTVCTVTADSLPEGWTDPITVGTQMMAFPPGAVMPLPIPCHRKWELTWDPSEPKWKPFCVSFEQIYSGVDCNFPYRVIWTEKGIPPYSVGARTDCRFPVWRMWWVLFRLQETLRLTENYLLQLAQIWGLGYFSPGKVATLRDIFRRKPAPHPKGIIGETLQRKRDECRRALDRRHSR